MPRHEWLPGEDALVARAMLRFGVADVAKARTYFLPSRAEADIAARIRKRTGHRARDNPIKARGPLRLLSMALLLQELSLLLHANSLFARDRRQLLRASRGP